MQDPEVPVRVVPPTMKAIVHREYGPPEALTLDEIPTPTPGAHEVLIRVVAAGASIGDHHIVTGKPYLVRLSPFGGVPRPTHAVPGATMAGRVAAVGERVTGFRIGDEVFGQALHGAFAEYLVIAAELIVHKPDNLSFEEAAAAAWGTTALQALRDVGEVKPNERVLVNGASGAVGSSAVQYAKVLGAHVTAVCSTGNVDLLYSLGADKVIDYTQGDFLEGGAQYDVVLDLVGNRPLAACKSVLTPNGRYVACSLGKGDWVGPLVRILKGLVTFLGGAKRFRTVLQRLDASDLELMRELAEARTIRLIIDRTWPFTHVAAALRHVGAGHSRGMNVVRVYEPDREPTRPAMAPCGPFPDGYGLTSY